MDRRSSPAGHHGDRKKELRTLAGVFAEEPTRPELPLPTYTVPYATAGDE